MEDKVHFAAKAYGITDRIPHACFVPSMRLIPTKDTAIRATAIGTRSSSSPITAARLINPIISLSTDYPPPLLRIFLITDRASTRRLRRRPDLWPCAAREQEP